MRGSGAGERASGVGEGLSGVGERASGVGEGVSSVGEGLSGVGEGVSSVGERASGVGETVSGVGERVSVAVESVSVAVEWPSVAVERVSVAGERVSVAVDGCGTTPAPRLVRAPVVAHGAGGAAATSLGRSSSARSGDVVALLAFAPFCFAPCERCARAPPLPDGARTVGHDDGGAPLPRARARDPTGQESFDGGAA